MRLKFGFLSALAAAALALGATSPARAITLTVNNPINSSSNSGVAGNGGATSSTTLVDNGGATADAVGAVLDGKTRYAFGAAADNGSNSAADTVTLNSNYSITFSVTPTFSGTVYDVQIDTSMLGGLTVVDDYALGNGTNGIASITNVTGTINAVGQAGLGLATAASQNGSSGTSETAVSKANVYTITGLTGPQVFTLNFTWSSTANSQTNTSTFDNSDEVGVRFGATINQGSNAADDYPGSPARTQANDGHFVTIKATITAVPEPSTFALLGLGLVGLAVARFRRK